VYRLSTAPNQWSKSVRFINETLLRLMTWLREERAQTMVEYSIILALVSTAAIGALLILGPAIFDAIQGCADGFG